MRREIAAVALASFLGITGAALADPSYVGEWVLNVQESKYPPGFPTITNHHMEVTKDDGTHIAYTDNFTVGNNPPAHSSFDGAYDGKPYKTSDGQMMAYFHTPTGYRDEYTSPNGTKGKDACDFSADKKRMTCHGEFTPPGATQPVTFLEVWDKTK